MVKKKNYSLISVNRHQFDLLATHSLTQNVHSSTHVGGHLLDVFLTRQLSIRRVDVSPPGGLSDHSMIVGHVDVVLPGQYDTVTRRTRSWRSFDVDAFLRDVTESPFVRCPPTDVNELFTEYFSTLSSLLDQHAPVRLQPTSSRRSEPWNDRVCRAEKRKTRRLERIYRRRQSTDARDAWAVSYTHLTLPTNREV